MRVMCGYMSSRICRLSGFGMDDDDENRKIAKGEGIIKKKVWTEEKVVVMAMMMVLHGGRTWDEALG